MVEIPLTRRKIAIVDDCDVRRVLRHKWRVHESRHMWYAKGRVDGKETCLHRFILGLLPTDPDVDHKDRNGLNNQRSNLRLADKQGNAANSGIRLDSTSGLKGVSWDKDKSKWRAQIRIDGQKRHVGYFGTRQEAAVAYDRAARRTFGEFARTNGDL